MTFLAVRAFLPFVLVVFLMTGVTIHRGVFIPIVRMAVFAGHLHMFALQRILGLIVLESNGLPGILRMAIVTRFSNAAFVFIIFLVAAIAC